MEQIKFPKFKTYTDQKVNYLQPKLDGHLTKIYTYTPKVICLTKNDKDITNKLLAINHIKQELENIPRDSVIFAELHCLGVDATSVPTMLNNADEKLMLTVFAAPLLEGADISGMSLTEVMFIIRDLGLDATHADKIPAGYITIPCAKNLLQTAIERKWEGWVLKEAHMKGWYKLKPTKTLDAFIVGTYQSFSSTHYGGLQAIHIAVYKSDGTRHDLGHVGSGFSLPYRKSLNTQAKRDTLIGKVCVIEYDKVGAKGALRFPRMAKDSNDNVIWRTDKDPKQCTTEQLEN